MKKSKKTNEEILTGIKHPKTRKDKIVLLMNYMDLGTELLKRNKFVEENNYVSKLRFKRRLDRDIKKCSECNGLNAVHFTESVLGWGNLNARIFFVNFFPGTRCMSTQVPLTGTEFYHVAAALKLSNLSLPDVFMSSIVHCHLTRDRKLTRRMVRKCINYLREELLLVKPQLVIAFGKNPKNIGTELNIKSFFEWFKLLEKLNCRLLVVRQPRFNPGMGTKDWIIKVSTEIDKCYKHD